MWFRNIAKEKALIDRELAVYRKEKLAEITLDIAESQEKGAKQEREFECEWHGRKEKRETELAVLNAEKKGEVDFLKERLKNYEAQYHAVVKAKDAHIESLEAALEGITEAIPQKGIVVK